MKVNLTVVSLAALLIIACLVLKGKGFTGQRPLGRRGQPLSSNPFLERREERIAHQSRVTHQMAKNGLTVNRCKAFCERARNLGCEKIQKTAAFEDRYKNK
ncbi:hypothetical protein P5673_029550 [Acropora cervicornis]|uniref:Uncharacterized protein n=1 Tax=Acropora cervicornis TaxID=6130 RepID=A0AAD9PVR9_ACRCE|nr:hypothetical protein P5673_029550 [Acropora cervicornis]